MWILGLYIIKWNFKYIKNKLMLNEVYYDLNLMKILYFDLLYFLKLNNSSIFK